MVASNCVPLTNFVGTAVPIHWTTLPASNADPLTARVKPAPPTTTELGFTPEIVGVLHCFVRLTARLNASTEPRPVTRSKPAPAVYPSVPAGQFRVLVKHGTILFPAVIS